MKILIFFILLFSSVLFCYANEKIKLSEVNTLTLYANRKTNGRRSAGVPQLECVGGSANCDHKYIPNVVQCTNAGSDGYDVQWTCKAELETNVKFGTIDVSCEGYDYPNDKYVLKGSCGLRYTLDRKSLHGDKTYYEKNKHSNYESNKQKSSNDGMFNILLIILVVVAVIAFVSWKNTRPQTVTGDPLGPPPPGFRPEYTGQTNFNEPPSYSSVFNDTKYSGQQQASGNNGPGFWSGLGAGGLMGYLYGSNTNTRHRGYERTFSSPYRENSYSGFDQPARLRTPSPEYRTASGFGGTSRR